MLHKWKTLKQVLKSKKKQVSWFSVLIVLPLLIGLTLYSLTQTKKVAARWWDETWLFRKTISINNANTENLENFQISFEIDTLSLISENKMQASCADLRVTDQEGNLLPHWIEEHNPGCNASNTKVWVKIPKLAKGNNASTIYVYYGNDKANSIEDGNNVFALFDNFENYTDWTGDTNNFALSSDGSRTVLTVSSNHTPGEIFKNTNFENKYIVEMAIRATNKATNSPHPGLIYASNGTVSDYYGFYLRASSDTIVETHNGSFGAFSSSQVIDTNWHNYKAIVNSGVLEALYFDSIRQTVYDHLTITNSYSHVGIWSHDPGTAYYDNLFVRKYASIEPSTSLSSVEEISPAPVGYWKLDEGSGSTVYDSSGQGNHGTISSVSWANSDSCISGQCLNFPGSGGGNINIPNSQTINFGTASFSISAWALHRDYTYPKSNFMIKKSLSCYANGAQNAGFDLGHGYIGSGIDVCIRDTSNNVVRSSLTFDPGSQPSGLINQWVHYVFVFDRNNNKVIAYINGKKQSFELDISTITSSISTTNPLVIGSLYGWQTDGLIDEIKIYPYIRNADQVHSDYIEGASKIGSKAVFGHRSETAPVTPLSSKLIAHWRFDEGSNNIINDSSGQNNHGTMFGQVSRTNAGKQGKGLVFDGITSRIQNIPTTAFEFRGEDFSISVWYKRSSSDNESYLISKPWNGSGGYNYQIAFDSANRLIVSLLGATSWSTQINNFSPRETWVHLGISFKESTKEVKIYRNGTLVQSSTHNISNWTPVSGNLNISLCIGSLYPYNSGWSGNTAFSFNGVIDEVKFYNATLSADEMLQDYNFGASAIMGQSPESQAGPAGSLASEYCIPGDTNPCSPPVGEWTFDENSGSVLKDISANNNHGNLIDMNNSNWVKGPDNFGSALRFDGNNYIQAANNMILGSAAFTLQGWFKANTHSSYGLGVFLGNASSSQAAWLGWCSSPQLGTANSIGGGFFGRNYGSGISDNNWHFLTLTFSGGTNGTVLLYADGQLKVTDTYTPNLASTSIMFGKANSGISYWYNGLIDQVRIYNYVRTPAQIAWDYNRGAPVAHWRLDDCHGSTAHDASVNNNHGTINIASSGSQNSLGSCDSGSSTDAWYNGREGKFNSSLNFDGTDDYIDLGNNDSIRNFTNQISVSAWAKYKAYGGGGQSYSVIAVKGSPWTFLLENYNQKIRFRITAGGADKNASDSEVHELNRWYHFVGTYDGANIKIYKDGKLVGTTPATGNLGVNDVSAKIGTFQGTNYNFNGQIDDVRIYNYALTQEQIILLYNDNVAVRF